jgi:hypothetical protein
MLGISSPNFMRWVCVLTALLWQPSRHLPMQDLYSFKNSRGRTLYRERVDMHAWVGLDYQIDIEPVACRPFSGGFDSYKIVYSQLEWTPNWDSFHYDTSQAVQKTIRSKRTELKGIM